MSILKEKINTDLVAAMRAKEELKVSVLRMLKAAVLKFEVSGDERKTVTDENVLQIIGKEVKQRKDSIDAFRKGDREQLAVKEENEMKILQTYLPAQLDEAAIRQAVSQVISQSGSVTKADFGKIMGAAMAQLKGQADGQVVGKIVGELLK